MITVHNQLLIAQSYSCSQSSGHYRHGHESNGNLHLHLLQEKMTMEDVNHKAHHAIRDPRRRHALTRSESITSARPLNDGSQCLSSDGGAFWWNAHLGCARRHGGNRREDRKGATVSSWSSNTKCDRHHVPYHYLPARFRHTNGTNCPTSLKFWYSWLVQHGTARDSIVNGQRVVRSQYDRTRCILMYGRSRGVCADVDVQIYHTRRNCYVFDGVSHEWLPRRALGTRENLYKDVSSDLNITYRQYYLAIWNPEPMQARGVWKFCNEHGRAFGLFLFQTDDFLQQEYASEVVVVIVRVTFDGYLFHPTEGPFRKVLPNYYIVIAWDRIDLFKQLLTRKYFIIVELRLLIFSRSIALEMHLLNSQNWTFL